MKRVFKSMVALALCASVLAGFAPTQAKALDFKKVTVTTINDINQIKTMNPTTSFAVTSTEDKKPQYDYLEINVPTDSWVYLSGVYTDKNWDTGETATALYTNSTMTNELTGDLNLSFGTGAYNESTCGFLTAGTYYMKVTTKKKPWFYLTSGYGKEDPFKATCNLTIAAIPVSKVFDITTTVAADKKSATVTFKNNLGEYLSYVQYQPGNIAASQNEDKAVWKRCFDKSLGIFDGGSNATVMDTKSGSASFTVTKNGYYTFLVHAGDSFNEAARYSKAIKIDVFDNTKPVVTGVKNGKTYKKAVKIKFSDKQSGIKSAKLNKKKIKSGKKVSKNGKYTLVVIDKAGNKTTVKFKIKKKK